MSRIDRYAMVFVLAFALSTVLWGIERHYTMHHVSTNTTRLTDRGDCWRDKYRAARFGHHIERSCEVMTEEFKNTCSLNIQPPVADTLERYEVCYESPDGKEHLAGWDADPEAEGTIAEMTDNWVRLWIIDRDAIPAKVIKEVTREEHT